MQNSDPLYVMQRDRMVLWGLTFDELSKVTRDIAKKGEHWHRRLMTSVEVQRYYAQKATASRSSVRI